jgi:hypothetical protein
MMLTRSILPGVLVALVASTAAQAADLKPTLAKTVVAAPIGGQVTVRAQGERAYRPLHGREVFAVGSAFDTTRGKVRLTTATPKAGETAWGKFSGSQFMVDQNRDGLTTLTMVGGRSEKQTCGRAAAVAARRPKPKVLRTLHAHSKGRFRTRGRYSSATVRGTRWDTVDECFSTRTIDREGNVEVNNGFIARNLSPGESAVGYCFPLTNVNKDRDYCISVLSNPGQGLFAFGIGLRQPPGDPYQLNNGYRLCVRAPSGTNRCQEYPLKRYRKSDLLIGAVVCFQDEDQGTYVARWFVNGKRIGIPLTFKATKPRPDLTLPCVS